MSPSPDPSVDSLSFRVAAALGDRYVIGKIVGEGAQATVFLARDLKHERSVAVKVLRQELTNSVSADRFLREILIAAGLTHPNILPVFDSGSEEGLLYYVMPYVDGEALSARLAGGATLSVGEALRRAREIAAALQYAHDRGVVHRDIKPANVLLSGGVAVVADFGLARALAPTAEALELTSEGTGLGTPAYMSPEQALGAGDVGAPSDQYALACVLFEMLTGRRPYVATTFQALVSQHVTAPPPNASLLRPEVPRRVSEAIIRALSKNPTDRFESVQAFITAAAGRDSARSSHTDLPEPAQRSSRWKRATFAAGTLVLIAAAWVGWMVVKPGTGGGTANLDRNLVAVAPFSAPEPQLAVWREGLSEVVARNLDGAGQLRTVSMTVVNKNWAGSNDPNAMSELGRRTGAASAISGTLLQSGPDSVRLTATVYDVAAKRSLGEVTLTEATVQMGRLAERLTIDCLRRLGQSKQGADARMLAARSTPLPALKAFLQGEYQFRRSSWDSAMVNYRQAVEIDSTMTLAYLRMSMVSAWQRLPDDSTAKAYAAKAALLNHGLAPRESLLVVSEALNRSLSSRFNDAEYATHVEQLFRTLEAATREYPDDRELWYSLGNARSNLTGKLRGALDALDKSIAIDSGFAPAYLDAVPVAMALGGTEKARRYLDAYLSLNPSDVHGDGLRLASHLLNPKESVSGIQSVLDTASADVILHALDVVAYWPDSAETTVRLARLFAAGRRTNVPHYLSPDFQAYQLAFPLAFRGHLTEAYRVLNRQPQRMLVAAMLSASLLTMDALPEAETARAFNVLKTGSMDTPTGVVLALPWWSARHDTASLRTVAERAERAARPGVETNAARYTRYLGGAARAFLALSRSDTTGAIDALTALKPNDCMFPYCPFEQLQLATLLSHRQRDAEAFKILDDIPNIYNPLSVRWRLARARVAERLGKRDEAVAAYGYVADAWLHADPSLLAEAREADAKRRQLSGSVRR